MSTEHDRFDMDDDPEEGSTCILACAFGLVVLFIYIGAAVWLANK